MELTLEAQTQAFIYSCVLGVILAVIYTAIGIIKIISPPSKKIVVCYGYTIYACVYIYNIFSIQY